MRFPETFTTEQKIKFYKQRSKHMTSLFNKLEGTNKLKDKIQEEITICKEEINKLKNEY